MEKSDIYHTTKKHFKEIQALFHSYPFPGPGSVVLWEHLRRCRWSWDEKLCHTLPPPAGPAAPIHGWEPTPSTKGIKTLDWSADFRTKMEIYTWQFIELTMGPSPRSRNGWWLMWTIAGSRYCRKKDELNPVQMSHSQISYVRMVKSYRESFSRAGLCNANHIFATQCNWPPLSLDGSWIGPVLFTDHIHHVVYKKYNKELVYPCRAQYSILKQTPWFTYLESLLRGISQWVWDSLDTLLWSLCFSCSVQHLAAIKNPQKNKQQHLWQENKNSQMHGAFTYRWPPSNFRMLLVEVLLKLGELIQVPVFFPQTITRIPKLLALRRSTSAASKAWGTTVVTTSRQTRHFRTLRLNDN